MKDDYVNITHLRITFQAAIFMAASLATAGTISSITVANTTLTTKTGNADYAISGSYKDLHQYGSQYSTAALPGNTAEIKGFVSLRIAYRPDAGEIIPAGAKAEITIQQKADWILHTSADDPDSAIARDEGNCSAQFRFPVNQFLYIYSSMDLVAGQPSTGDSKGSEVTRTSTDEYSTSTGTLALTSNGDWVGYVRLPIDLLAKTTATGAHTIYAHSDVFHRTRITKVKVGSASAVVWAPNLF